MLHHLLAVFEAAAAEGTLIETKLLNLDVSGKVLILGIDENEERLVSNQPYPVATESIILLDGKPAKLSDLQEGSTLTLRLDDDRRTIRAIRAAGPEKDDDAATAGEDQP